MDVGDGWTKNQGALLEQRSHGRANGLAWRHSLGD